MLRGVLAATAVPVVIVEFIRRIRNDFVPISRVEGHRTLRFDGIDRKPPVELGHWCRIPSITVRMMCVADTAREISVARHHAQAWHVYVSLVDVTAQISDEIAQKHDGLRVVNEFRL